MMASVVFQGESDVSVNPYARQADILSDREREALLFEKMRGRILLAKDRSEFDLERTRALADLHRLWTHVATLVSDDDNKLPQELRASIVSVAMAMLRDLDGETPDLDFHAEVLGNFAEGLRATAAPGSSQAPAGLGAMIISA
jgi:flagellar biosynthesis regulator FlaF